MKKTLILLMALFMTFSSVLSGCGSKTEDPGSPPEDVVNPGGTSTGNSETTDDNSADTSNGDISDGEMKCWKAPFGSVSDKTMEKLTRQEDETKMKMNVQTSDYTFTATLEQNQAVNEFVTMMKEGPVTIEMSDYSGFEKVGPLGKGLTTDNHQTTTTEGDIVLYNGNQIVIFYGSNSWSYTRIGKIDNLTNWKKALGSGNVTAVFTAAE